MDKATRNALGAARTLSLQASAAAPPRKNHHGVPLSALRAPNKMYTPSESSMTNANFEAGRKLFKGLGDTRQDVAHYAVKQAFELVKAKETSDTIKAHVRSTLIENTAGYVTTAISYTKPYLTPIYLAPLGITAGTLAGVSGIGIPVIVTAAIAVAFVMRAHKLNAKIRLLLADHFNSIIFFIKNFSLVQKIFSKLKINYNSNSTNAPAEDSTSILNRSFLASVTKYSIILNAQVSHEKVDAAQKSRLQKIWSSIMGVKSYLFDASTTITELEKAFNEMRQEYLLEIARFTTIIFFNFDNFQKISSDPEIKALYNTFAKANIFPPRECTQITNGKPISSSCVVTGDDVEKEFNKNMKILESIVSPTDFEVGGKVRKLIEEKTDMGAVENHKKIDAAIEDIHEDVPKKVAAEMSSITNADSLDPSAMSQNGGFTRKQKRRTRHRQLSRKFRY